MTLTASLISELVHKVNSHEYANQLPLTDYEVIEDAVCRDAIARGMVSGCTDGTIPEPPEPSKGLLASMKAAVESGIISTQRAIDGVKMLKGWLGEGYASQGEADERAQACVNCPLNINVKCASCAAGALMLRIVHAVGTRKTPFDNRLLHCSECGCSNRIKVWVPMNVIQRNTSAESMDRLPENCWIKKGATL